MRRQSPFPLSVDRWQRADWLLLQNSAVHRVDDAAALQRTAALLTDLGWLAHTLDAAGCGTADDLHTVLATALSFPGHYGRSPDALNDVLSDVAGYEYGSDPATTGTALLVDGFDRIVDLDPGFAHAVLDVFAGHPMLCVVVTTAALPEVGCEPA
jgi:hypothetical protein